ncbi:MAG TPA: glycosyltransferase [Flavitalea sp.]|nr:glycosyltransferase [Flavitalea sp.]
MAKLSVIICTHNPNKDVFDKCLKSISSASYFFQPHEILIIDNNCSDPLSKQHYILDFLADCPNARIIIEGKQGLTPSRLKGISESFGEVLLFIDDDNFVRDDFFRHGNMVADKYKHIGAWSGQVKLLFEEPPPAWTKRYWGLLVHREFQGIYWSNLPHLSETMPYGAGLFIRRSAADHYLHLHHNGKRSIQLDRNGTSLFSAGDNDLAACACDVGLGVGIFDSLILDHFIPKRRVSKQYLLELAENISHSGIVFRSFRGELPAKINSKTKIANMIRLMLKNPVQREFQKAVYKGEKLGRNTVNNHHLLNKSSFENSSYSREP